MAARFDGMPRERQIAIAGVVMGPGLFAAGLAVTFESSVVDRLLVIERASVQWAIALPLLVVAPAVLSLAWADEAIAGIAKWVSRGISLGIGIGVVLLVAATTTHLGCEPVTNPIQTLPKGAVLGLVIAGGFFAAVAAGRWFASSERPRSALIAGILVAVLFVLADIPTFAIFNMGVSCARGPV